MTDDAQHDYSAGRWALYLDTPAYGGGWRPTLRAIQIESDTPKLIRGKNGINHYGRQAEKCNVIFVVADGIKAKEAVQKSEGINGEMNSRVTVAKEWAKLEIMKMCEESYQ